MTTTATPVTFPKVTFRAERLIIPGAADQAECFVCDKPATITYISGGVRSYWCGDHIEEALNHPEANGSRR